MLKSILSVVAGIILWTGLWVGWNAVLANFYPQEFSGQARVETVSALILLIAGSVSFSIVAGYVTAWIARHSELKHTLALGIVQLGLGIFFEASNWALLPVWYHVIFLMLLIPANLAGGWLRARQK